MKTPLLIALTFGAFAFAGLPTNLFSQESAGTTGEGTPVAPLANQRITGFAIQDGIAYFVQNSRVLAVNSVLIPAGQVMTATGRLESQSVATSGFTLEDGVLCFTRGETKQRLDAGIIPAGRIMTLKGELVPMPNGIVAFPGAQSITVQRPVPQPD
jgi:hypothetical protein